LLTTHNVHFLLQLAREMREAILAGRFPSFVAGVLAPYES
jgi:tRNA-guanine family transglycosylase